MFLLSPAVLWLHMHRTWLEEVECWRYDAISLQQRKWKFLKQDLSELTQPFGCSRDIVVNL